MKEGEGEGNYRVESEGVIGSGRSLIDVSCQVEWSAVRDGAQQRWKMKSTVVLRDGCGVCWAGAGCRVVARDGYWGSSPTRD